MKKIKITLFMLFIVSISFAQEIKPKFEKEGGLVKATYFYETGEVKQQGFFKEEKLHSKWISYDKSGNKTTIAFYQNGQKTGTWLVLNDGKVKQIKYGLNKIIEVKNLKDTSLAVY